MALDYYCIIWDTRDKDVLKLLCDLQLIHFFAWLKIIIIMKGWAAKLLKSNNYPQTLKIYY